MSPFRNLTDLIDSAKNEKSSKEIKILGSESFARWLVSLALVLAALVLVLAALVLATEIALAPAPALGS